MKTAIQTFQARQTMSSDGIEFFHYKDLTFGKVQPHAHEHYELYFFLNGDTYYTVGDRQFHLKKGDFMIIEPNQLHFPDVKVNVDTAYERFIIWVRPEYLERLLDRDESFADIIPSLRKRGSCHFRPDAENMQKIFSTLEEMMHESSEQEIGYALAIDSLFCQLLIRMNRIVHDRHSYQRYKPTQDLYSQIIRYIHENIQENLSLDDLAQEFFVSRSYISRIVRQHLDISVHEYILNVKLDHVLTEVAGGKPITEAAEDYGFNNYSTFYRLCTKRYGLSPREITAAEETDI